VHDPERVPVFRKKFMRSSLSVVAWRERAHGSFSVASAAETVADRVWRGGLRPAANAIGYQDLGALLVRQPAVTERVRENLIASPFGTIHAATFSMPRPVGTAIPHPAGLCAGEFRSGRHHCLNRLAAARQWRSAAVPHCQSQDQARLRAVACARSAAAAAADAGNRTGGAGGR